MTSVPDRSHPGGHREHRAPFDPSLWWNGQALLKGEQQLQARSVRKRTLYLASSAEPGLAEATRGPADVLKTGAFPGVEWHYEPMPQEQHATLYHPAALLAFRRVFKP